MWGGGGPTAASAEGRAVPLSLFCSADPPGEENASASDASAHMDSKVRHSTAPGDQGCEKCKILAQNSRAAPKSLGKNILPLTTFPF